MLKSWRFNHRLWRKLFVVAAMLFSTELIANPTVYEEKILLQKITDATFTSSVNPDACVLMIHGWVSNMDEVGGMFERLSNRLSTQNIASLRVNIRGESEREKSNYRLTSTFKSRLSDAERGLNYLKKTCKKKPIGIVGFSLGGVTAISLAGAHSIDIDSVVLWSSAINPAEIFNGIQPKSVIRDIINKGEGIYNDFEKITVTKQHYLGMQGYFPIDNFERYHGALLTLRGSEDFVPMHDVRIINAASSERSEFRLIKGANHIFNTFDVNHSYDESVIDYTQQWFQQTLQ